MDGSPPGSSVRGIFQARILVSVAQLCLTLCDPVDCILPGFSVHGILQARILEWVSPKDISFSKGQLGNHKHNFSCFVITFDPILILCGLTSATPPSGSAEVLIVPKSPQEYVWAAVNSSPHSSSEVLRPLGPTNGDKQRQLSPFPLRPRLTLPLLQIPGGVGGSDESKALLLEGGSRELSTSFLTAGPDGEESACDARDADSIPGLGRSPGGGHGNPVQYSCLENPLDRGAWRATVPEVPKSRARLSGFHFSPL